MSRMGRRPKTEAERQFDVEMGRRLTIARKDMRLTTAEFAARAGISTGQLYQYEVGNSSIPLRLWIVFSKILHVSLVSFIQTTSFCMKSENRCSGCARNV